MDKKKTILVTGANGQLGMEFRTLVTVFPAYVFLFVTRDELPINDREKVKEYFSTHAIDHCINCAAYTAVDKAETEKEIAFDINGYAVGNLAAICKEYGSTFIHFSTDYVFNGNASTPYIENGQTDPVNLYGASKLLGEQEALKNNPGSIIIRTAWVYSSYGKNFVKTMLRLMSEKDEISVVNDQVGSPTYAYDLAMAVMQIITNSEELKPGTYHYSNSGVISWYEFATAIKEISGCSCTIKPVPSSSYPTPAKRPGYSVLDTTKIQQSFNINIPHWKESLQSCIALLAL